jgi:hypothetical protein
VTEDDGTQGREDNRNEAGINVSRVIKNMARVGFQGIHEYISESVPLSLLIFKLQE